MKSSLPRSVFFGFLSWVLPLGLTFAATPQIVHWLGAEEYGLYALILGFISYSFTFSTGRAVTKYVAHYHSTGEIEQINDILSATLIINLAVGTIGAVVLSLLSGVLVRDVLMIQGGDLQAKAVIAFYIAAATLATWMLGQVYSSVLQALGRFDLFSQATLATSAVQTLGSVFLVWSGYGSITLLWWNLLTGILTTAGFYLFARKLLPDFTFSLSPKKESFKLVGQFSVGVIGYQILSNILLLFERSIITRRLGTEALTFYVVPMSLSFYIHHFVGSLTLVLFPMTSGMVARQDSTRLLSVYQRATKFVCLTVAFLGVTLATISRVFLGVWLSQPFADNSTWIFVFHVATYSLMAILIVSWQMCEGHGYLGYNVGLIAVFLLISVPLMIYLSPVFYGTGVAAARFIGVLTIPVFIGIVERRIFGAVLWQFWSDILSKLLIAGAICGLVEHFALLNLPRRWIGVFSAVAIGGAFYIVAIFAIKYLSGDEKLWFKNFLKRVVVARA